MLQIDIPGFAELELAHLVLDYNGTAAFDGELLPGVGERIRQLSGHLNVHAVTADTFGTVRAALADEPCTVHVLPKGQEEQAKLAYVKQLGAEKTACIGNGRNDRLMLAEAAVGLALMQDEGLAKDALLAADAVLPGICPALDLFLHPKRLIATLRS